MKPRMGLLIAAALWFAGWIGWLAYLAATTTQPIVLSRPQLLVATLDVIAEVNQVNGVPDPHVIVREVFWSKKPPKEQLDKITISNLADCDDWKGPGTYIIPLVRDGEKFSVPSIPRSPGFEPERNRSRPRIYRETPDTRQQLDAIRRAEPAPD